MRLKVQPKADPQNCQSERGGAMLLFLALGLAATLIGVAALTVNIGLTSSIRSEMRNAVDASAQAAVAMMCSTRECYESAKLEALKSLELLLPPFLDDQRRSTPIRLDPDGGPEWQVGDLTVRFERGRWFSDGPPPQMESIISTHPNLQFEPFDLVDASEPSWQEQHPNQPEHVVANAAYIEVRHNFKMPVLNMIGLFNTELVERVYAHSANIDGNTVCVPPFAIPVCALLDDTGEFDKAASCRLERYFTGTNRYCPEGDPNCNIVPGTMWTPLIDETDVDEYIDSDISPKPHVRQQCSYESYPLADSSLDHFGVVGLPAKLLGSRTITESDIQNVLTAPGAAGRSNGCVPTQIGDVFSVLPGGLTVDESDTAAWSAISTEAPAEFHPSLSDTFLISGVPTLRAADDSTFLKGAGADRKTIACRDHSVSPKQFPKWGSATGYDYGVCRSKHLMLHQDCWLELSPNFQGSWGPSMAQLIPIPPCPFNPATFKPDENFFKPGNTSQANLGAWSIEEGYFRQPQVQVWQVPIPVIASLGDLALRTPSKFCAGVGTGTADPSISENETQIIIGFIEAVFYDVDIGSAGIPAPTTADFSVHGGLLLTKPDGTPRRLPISFKENIGQNCNMVKGVTHCDVGLISTVGSFRLQDPQNVRLERRDD